MTRRFRLNSELKKKYGNFMCEYEVLGHIRRVPLTLELQSQRVYIPRHPVFREDSATTHLYVSYLMHRVLRRTVRH